MKKTRLLFLLLFTFSIVNAQEKFKAVYDYQTDLMFYLSLDAKNNVTDTLKQANLKRGSILQVEVKNVNPFALTIRTTVEEEDLSTSSTGFNFGSLLGSIQNLSGNSLPINIPEIPESANSFANGSRGNSSVEDLKKLTTGIQAIKKMIMSNMRNPNLTKTEIIRNIKNLAGQYDDLRLPDPEDNLYLFLETLNELVKSDVEALNAAIDQEEGTTATSRGASTKTALRSFTNYNQNEVNDIVDMYASIEAASFKQIYDYTVQADKAHIEMSFIPKNVDNQIIDERPIKVRSIPVKARGGFKINTSVALTLNNYSDDQDFFIDPDGLIGATPDDNFTPHLSTMINFYPVIGEGFNIGGSFGLSIPIVDEPNGINFLLGPSVFFGNKNRLSLSGGIAFGPISQLTNGLEVGDEAIGNDIESFTKNEYEAGFYLGISFSLFDFN